MPEAWISDNHCFIRVHVNTLTDNAPHSSSNFRFKRINVWNLVQHNRQLRLMWVFLSGAVVLISFKLNYRLIKIFKFCMKGWDIEERISRKCHESQFNSIWGISIQTVRALALTHIAITTDYSCFTTVVTGPGVGWWSCEAGNTQINRNDDSVTPLNPQD